MDLSKFSTEDLQAIKAGDLSAISTEGLLELKRQQSPQSVADKNLAALDGKGPLDDLKSISSGIGNMVKAGYSGVADLIAGNGLDTSASNVKKVEDEKLPSTAAANLGETLGSQFTPAQIALQAGFGKIADIIGPWVADAMKGWAADVAVNAVGKIKSIAKNLGVTNLDALGKFLMTPIKLAGKEFEPIVQATSSPQQMLDTANAIKVAAGKQLGMVSEAVDGVIKGAVGEVGNALNDAPVVLDMGSLISNVKTLKEEAVGDLPNLGKATAKQFDDALKDLEVFVQKQLKGDTSTMFSDLSSIKTKLGNLIYKHGSPLESKAALNDVYQAISSALKDAASKVGTHGEAYIQANEVYHQIAAVVEGLEGKVIDAKKLFDAPAFLAAMSTGLSTVGAGHGVLAGITAPIAYGATKVAEKYGPQAIAQGLDKGAPLVAKGLQLTARGIPVAAKAITDAISQNSEE